MSCQVTLASGLCGMFCITWALAFLASVYLLMGSILGKSWGKTQENTLPYIVKSKANFKFLWTQIRENFSWSLNTPYLLKKVSQILFVPNELKEAGLLSADPYKLFPLHHWKYTTLLLMRDLQHVAKTELHTIRVQLSNLPEICSSSCSQGALSVVLDFKPVGCSTTIRQVLYESILAHSNRLNNHILPQNSKNIITPSLL